MHCDASGCGLGAALVQKDTEGGEHPVAYFSRTLSKAERNYSTTERELLAVVAAVDHFKHYIDGSHFTVVTDHSSLKWLSKLENPTGRLARWATRLSQYDFDIVHKKGALNTVPDVLSRIEVNILTYDCDTSTDLSFNRLLAGIRRAPAKFDKFKIDNNMLFKYVTPRTPLHESTAWKILVPEELRKDLITSTHSHPTNAHLGPYKTLKKLQILYSWPKMQADVDKVLNTCEVCKAYKPTNQKPLGQMKRPRNVSAPMQSLSMDLVGPLPRSTRGHNFLLTVVDIFTKYCWICPLRKPTAANIIKCLEKDIFLEYGTPATIICDNGQQFVSNIFKNFISSYGIETTFYNAVYSPQCNPVERANRTIETAIASYVTNNHKVWDANVPQIQAAINSTTSLAHSYTPHFLMHGMELILDGKARRNTNGNGPSNRTAHATRLTALAHVFQEVQDKLFEAFQTNQRHYNLRRKDGRSEERRVGKECRSRWSPYH